MLHYLIVNLPVSGYEEYMLVEGTEYPAKYYAYGTHLHLNEDVVCYADDIKGGIGWEKASFITPGKNLFNLETVSWGKYFIYNGTFKEHDSLGHSSLIVAKPDTLYSVTYSPNYPSHNSIAALYNADGALIDTAKATLSDNGDYWTFTTNSKCAYIMLNLAKAQSGPILLHVITKKGKGYKPAEENPDLFHGIGKFDAESGKTLHRSRGRGAVAQKNERGRRGHCIKDGSSSRHMACAGL